MKPRIPQSQLDRLYRIRKVANLVDFAGMEMHIGGKTYGPFGDEVGNAIREATRIYRESWLNPELDELIAWGEGK